MVEDSQRVSNETAVSATATAAMTAASVTTTEGAPPLTIASTTLPASSGVATPSSALTTLTPTNPPSLR